jgi:hypothetical protein
MKRYKKGMHVRKLSISDMGCVIWTPVMPNSDGRIRIRGRKYTPCLLQARKVALAACPVD